MSHVALPFVGFAIGVCITSIGGGGGSLYLGVLTAFFGVTPAVAVTTSLATGLATTAMGSYAHWRAGNVNRALGFTMFSSAVAAAVAGSLISNLIPEGAYTKITGLVLLGLVAQMVYAYTRRRKYGARKPNASPTQADTAKAVAFGAFGGLLSGVMGLSGGVLIVAGLMLLGCSSLETVGTSVFVLFGMAAVSFCMHIATGAVDWMLVVLLGSGTVLGAWASPRLLARVSKERLEVVLQPAMIVLCAIMAIMLLIR